MTLTLHFHPLASFCHKALIAFYENGVAYEPNIVDLGDPDSRAAFAAIWPIAKMPVLVDAARGETIVESTLVIEYLDQHYPGPSRLVPQDLDDARRVRFHDRFFDHYVQEPMSKVVTDRIRPEGMSDPYGVEQARALLATAYDILERNMAGRSWVMGEAFTLADCAAAPALFYADKVASLDGHPNAKAYLGRLMARPSYARVLREAEPYFAMFPQ
jgi:glutathione S-transferase